MNRKKIKQQIVAVLLMVAVLFECSSTVCATEVEAKQNYMNELGSLADSYKLLEGEFVLTEASRFFVVSSIEPSGEVLQTVQLIQQQFAADNVPGEDILEIVWGAENQADAGDIVIKIEDNSEIGDEGYQLQVKEKAYICAKDVSGLLYGANMLLKYFRTVDSYKIKAFECENTPDTKERTVMLDCGRKYFTAEWICNYIRQMSWMGYNTLELHFSEDGGFRADFWDPAVYTDVYHPENDFSWLCGSHIQSWVKDPYRDDPDKNKYLTATELIRILEVANQYHIDVIPSFDSPSHMDYITWKFEQNYNNNPEYSFTYEGKTYTAASVNGAINYTGKTGATSPTWPYYSTVDITDGTVAEAFVFALYEDIADFFKAYGGCLDFSIGADEVNLNGNYGFKWGYPEFVSYVNELNGMLNEKGYTCRMFNDFIGSKTYNIDSDGNMQYVFDDNIEIMYWSSDFNPTTGKHSNGIWSVDTFWSEQGRTVYNCIKTNCYYVLRVAASNTKYPNMDARNPENYNWTFYHSTEDDIYNEWYSADISVKGKYKEDTQDVASDQLGGGYFLVWNDYAALNTEEEIWNDVKDNTGTSEYVYSLINRMWSNIIKMDNSDVNDTVSYENFAKIRDRMGEFPGFTQCSEKTVLPSPGSPVKSHIWEDDYTVDKKATCTEEGQESIHCAVCDAIQDGSIRTVEKTAHIWDDGVITKKATCIEEGIKTYRCTASGCEETRTEEVNASGHTWKDEYTVDKEATCKKEGQKSIHCIACNAVKEGSIKKIKKAEHAWNDGEITKKATRTEEGIKTYTCTANGCKETKTESVVFEGIAVERIWGASRYMTSLAIAEELKAELGVSELDSVVIASGENFPDALAGSYLASKVKAPILMINHDVDNISLVQNYVINNLKDEGNVYILGGNAAVPEDIEVNLKAEKYNVVRLKGKDRYATNLAILEKAGVTNEKILVCTGDNFADSLSASATGLPILLVDSKTNSLTDAQKAFLAGKEGQISIIGGTGAVSEVYEKALEAYDKDVERVKGASRYETSVEVAKAFCGNPEEAVIAYAQKFPDGLCGGPLAYMKKAPLILTGKGQETVAAAYVADKKIFVGSALGGTGVLSDETVKKVFQMNAEDKITGTRYE